MPHHADAGHGGAPTHFLGMTGDAHHFAWQDRDLSTPNVIDIWYDFRNQNGFTNSITVGQTQRALDALTEWENASSGAINFIQNTTAAAADIINIGTGDLAALGSTSAPGGTLGLGGGFFSHNANHTITGGVAWQDFAETWDETIGNGNPAGTFDYYTVVAQEIGHALGLGHTDDLAGADIMDGTYTGEFAPAPFSANDVAHITSVYADPLIVTSTVDDAGLLGTLRYAIVFANTLPGPATITLQAETYNLTVSGTGGAAQGDFEIERHITIVGAGAGATVIDASTLTTRDRIFEVLGNSASLNLSRVTLTGGLADAGGAIKLNNNGTAGVKELRLTDVAIVGNQATVGAGIGGGLYLRLGTEAVLTRSVVTDNSASNSTLGGGGIWVDAHPTINLFGTAVLDRTVVAKNTALVNPDLMSDAPGGAVQAKYISSGGNLITDVSGAYFEGGLQTSDYVSSNVQYVVTSVVDSFDHGDDATALSIREAIDSANLNDNVAENIWLPSWDYVLTRDRATFGFGTTDMNIAFGDLDISDTLTVRGSGLAGNTSVAWRPGVVDAVFDLLGDFNQDGQTNQDVSGSDFLTWQTQLGSGSVDPSNWELFSADGDDDGDVDGDDLSVWSAHYSNTLGLFGVMAQSPPVAARPPSSRATTFTEWWSSWKGRS